MRVIIVGASKVGFALAKHICEEGYDLVVIDKDPESIDEITDAFDCNGVVGNGSSPKVLKKAGIDSATVLVALTREDEANLLCCNVAKKLGVKRTIASVRTPELADDKSFFYKNMGVDMLINPDRSAAREVSKMIRYAGAVEIERFGDGNVLVATVEIAQGSILADVEMPQVQSRLGAPVLVCAIDRKILKKAVVVGGSKVGCYLTELLMEQGVKVTLVDRDPERCQELLEAYPGANIVNGDGADSEMVERELHGADACVAATDLDEKNLIISMFAKSYGLDRIAAVIDKPDYTTMLRKSGINHIFSTRDTSLFGIIRDARLLATASENADDDNEWKWLHTLNDGKVEAAEFVVGADFKLAGIPFRDDRFALKPGILIAMIQRGQETILAGGNATIQQGDRIIVVSAEHRLSRLPDIIA